MSEKQFTAFMTKWALRTNGRMTAVFRNAAQEVHNQTRLPKAQGGLMPVITGNLRRSLLASTSSMPSLAGYETKFDREDATANTMVIANAPLGSTIYMGFQAGYARWAEMHNGFVRSVAQRWPEIVQKSARDIERSVEGR